MDKHDRARAEAKKRIGHLYSRFGYRRDDEGSICAEQQCTYCGLRAETQDHVPPLVWVHSLGSEFFNNAKTLLLIVPACLECNITLSNYRLFTIKERTRYLLGRYTKKYKRFLRGTAWTEEELDELGYSLKTKIEAIAICQLGIDRRIQIIEENLRGFRL